MGQSVSQWGDYDDTDRFGPYHAREHRIKSLDLEGMNLPRRVSFDMFPRDRLILAELFWGGCSQAIDLFAQLGRLNPVEPGWITRVRAIAHFTAARYEEAVSIFKSLESPPNFARGWLAASLAQSGHVDEAQDVLAEFLTIAEQEMTIFPGRELEAWRSARYGIEYKNDADSQRFFEGLKKAGLAS